MDEKKLIENAQAGDKQAMAELIKKYEQTIYNFAFKICRNKDYAEQIMQETFYSMVKSLHQFDHNSKLSTWLYRIVANHCLMMARKAKSRQFVSLDDEENLFEDKYAADWSSIPYKDTENKELKKFLIQQYRIYHLTIGLYFYFEMLKDSPLKRQQKLLSYL